jgi:type VI secretion system secreted protein Hcp
MKIVYTLIILGFVLTGIGLTNDAYGAAYIKFEGVDGEATDKDHKGWSDLLSFSEISTTGDDSATSRTSGDTTLGDVVIVKELDKASPKLAEAIVMGKVFPTVLINLCSDGESDCYLSYELLNVMITSYSISGDADVRPTEEFSLNFEKMVRSPTSDQQTREGGAIDETIMEPKPKVPDWVQTTAQFWVDKDVSDREFTDALGFLVKERIIEIEVESQLSETDQLGDEEPQVPAWIATTTEWWINGEVPEDQFLEGIKWMIKNKIIRGV